MSISKEKFLTHMRKESLTPKEREEVNGFMQWITLLVVDSSDKELRKEAFGSSRAAYNFFNDRCYDFPGRPSVGISLMELAGRNVIKAEEAGDFTSGYFWQGLVDGMKGICGREQETGLGRQWEEEAKGKGGEPGTPPGVDSGRHKRLMLRVEQEEMRSGGPSPPTPMGTPESGATAGPLSTTSSFSLDASRKADGGEKEAMDKIKGRRCCAIL